MSIMVNIPENMDELDKKLNNPLFSIDEHKYKLFLENKKNELIRNNNNGKLKKYFTEALLCTATAELQLITDWIYWHLFVIKFNHLIIIDNSNSDIIKIACEKFNTDLITYIDKRNVKISQSEIYTEYINNSDSYWVLPIDDDEFLYVSDKYDNNVNKLIYTYETNNPLTEQIFKYSFSWMFMFSDHLIEDSDESCFNLFDKYAKLNIFEYEDFNIVKTMVNTNIKHLYYNNAKLKQVYLKDINAEELTDLYSNFKTQNLEHLGSVHNPISKLYGKFIHAYNITNGYINVGYKTYKDIDHTADAFIMHFKYRTKKSWLNKFNRVRFDDTNNDYYNNAYKYSKIDTIYNFVHPNCIEFNNAKLLYNKEIQNSAEYNFFKYKGNYMQRPIQIPDNIDYNVFKNDNFKSEQNEYYNNFILNNAPKIIVTMTSYPKRINYLARRIYNFITTQTENIDIFYLWLSVEEFPNKEKDLPLDLLKICTYFNIQIMWVNKNEYCHKRWYVYPKHYTDIVISIDDDTDYDKDVIKFAKSIKDTKSVYNLFQNITCYSLYQGLRFIRYENTTDTSPSIYKTFVGQCIFTPYSFPLDAIKPENIKLRQKYCPICDECWLMPFIKFNNTGVGSMPVIHNEIVEISEINKTYNKLQTKITSEDLTAQDMYLYIVLRLFPDLYNKWITLFPSYRTISGCSALTVQDKFDNKTIDELLTMITIN